MQVASLSALTVHIAHPYLNAGRVSKTLPKAAHLFPPVDTQSLYHAVELPRYVRMPHEAHILNGRSSLAGSLLSVTTETQQTAKERLYKFRDPI